MKNLITITALCLAGSVFAQTGDAPVGQSKKGDVVELVGIDQMPLPLPPGDAEKMRKISKTVAADGISALEKSPEMVRGFFTHMNTAKTYIARKEMASSQQQNKDDAAISEIYKDLSKLKTRFKPKSLHGATLIAAAPSGTKINGTWTGLERFFHIKGAGSVRLSEVDLGATGGKFYMMKEAVNVRVHGKPAISKVFVDESGQTIEEIVWVEDGKFYMLTFGPDLLPGTKAKAAAHVTAHLLAQQLF